MTHFVDVPSASSPSSDAESSVGPAAGRGRLATVLIAVLAVAVLVIAGFGGYSLGHSRGGSSDPSATSVDAGFAWDMSVHHTQAVVMASYTRDHTSDPLIKTLAYDIETSQYNQVGQMTGWIASWGLPANSTQSEMSWMGMSMSDGELMPGMATPAQMTALEKLTGKALDVMFLQLMLHHHQGGLPMAQYAAAHATEPYVKRLAQTMVTDQGNEIVQMEQYLRERGAVPLPAP